MQSIYQYAETIARSVVKPTGARCWNWEGWLDRLLTLPAFGLPTMLLVLAAVFWLTITGANYPSQLIARGLFWIEDIGSTWFTQVGIPWWLVGFLWHGVYRGLAWVVSVMLPPMAIFFPCFIILEDLGYLPRVAFNLDWLFKKAGSHGKQALTMTMGYGCNAAGVIATRVIDSPLERLIAILTNNFAPCNGRFPTLIMLTSVFVAASFSAALTSLVAAGSIVIIVVIGILFALVTLALLSHTLLKGEASAFTLELPSYRKPNVGRILYTSLIGRSIFVLLRAIQTAVPAGGVIWILGNLSLGGVSLAQHIATMLNPLGVLIRLDGVILLAYVIAIPANEIAVPTMLIVYMGSSMMTDVPSLGNLRAC